MNLTSTISEFYRERSVFITGASGFVGKVLLEKLLRDCPLIKNIYILLRPKCGQHSRQRLNELLSSVVFDRIREENASALNKVVAITGDVTYAELGISPNDRDILVNNVSIIFHSAATVRFDEPLKRALQINVRGTQRVLQLAHKLKHLEALVHVSTAYCNIDKSDVNEIVYQESIPPEKIIDASEWMDDELLHRISVHLYSGRPSSYHYTKALAENLVAQEGNNLPLSIVRPSIITASWREPMPGWIDNYNGPTGYLVVSGKGVLRTMYVHQNKLCDIVPVDVVTNTCIVSSWVTSVKRPSSALVINCTSGSLNGITWGQIRNLSNPLLLKHPSMEMFRYPGPNFHSTRIWHELNLYIEHSIPAFVIDLLFKVLGHKPILTQVYQKVHRSIAALEYFTINEWTFRNQNQLMIYEEMSSVDKEIFCTDIRQIDWSNYMEDYVLGVRQYLLKEKPETLPEARKRLKRLNYQIEMLSLFNTLFYATQATKVLIAGGLAYLMSSLYYATQAAKVLIAGGLIYQLVTNANTIRRYLQYFRRVCYHQQ